MRENVLKQELGIGIRCSTLEKGKLTLNGRGTSGNGENCYKKKKYRQLSVRGFVFEKYGIFDSVFSLLCRRKRYIGRKK